MLETERRNTTAHHIVCHVGMIEKLNIINSLER